MSELIESYKKAAEVLDQKFLDLFREKVKMYDNFRTNLLLESDETLHYTSYSEILDLIKKHAYEVRVGDWRKYNKEHFSQEVATLFLNSDKMIDLKTITFYFNEEVEKYCMDKFSGKYVYVNIDENINSNVFLGTVVDIACYDTDPKIFIDEPESNMRCDEDISGDCDNECCAKRVKFVETIRTINSQNPFPSSIKHDIDNHIWNCAEESLRSFQTNVSNDWVNKIFEYYVSEGFMVTRTEFNKSLTTLKFEW